MGCCLQKITVEYCENLSGILIVDEIEGEREKGKRGVEEREEGGAGKDPTKFGNTWTLNAIVEVRRNAVIHSTRCSWPSYAASFFLCLLQANGIKLGPHQPSSRSGASPGGGAVNQGGGCC